MIPTFNKSYSLSVVLYFTRNPPNLITAWALAAGGSGEKIKLLASSIFDSAPPSHQWIVTYLEYVPFVFAPSPHNQPYVKKSIERF